MTQVISKERFNELKANLTEETLPVTLAYRHATIMDDEQIRIIEDYRENGENYIKLFPKEIQSKIREKLDQILKEEKPEILWAVWGDFVDIVEPYIANRDFKEEDWEGWEQLLFEDRYEDYVAYLTQFD